MFDTEKNYNTHNYNYNFNENDFENIDVRTPLIPLSSSSSPETYDNHIKKSNILQNSYYPKFLILIGIFYILPSLQFVIFQSNDNGIYCYYNIKCYHQLDFIPAFNAIISNALYIIFGFTYIIIVKLSDKYHDPSSRELGLRRPPHLYYALGISLIFEGLCSATYHICPTKLNFQFDTTFMFIGAVLMYITIYSKRHEEPEPMKIYSFLCFLIFVNILPLSGLTTDFEQYFWGVIFVIIAYIMINVSIYIYYGKYFELDIQTFKSACNKIKKIKKKEIPKLVLLGTINLFTLGMYVWAVITQPTFTDWVLGLIIINMIIYFCFYLIQKMVHREKMSAHLWVWMVIDLTIIILSLIFFIKTSTDIFLTPTESEEMNEPCVVLNYFDYHDIWHILSATGLFIFMIIVYYLDRDIDAVSGQQVPIF